MVQFKVQAFGQFGKIGPVSEIIDKDEKKVFQALNFASNEVLLTRKGYLRVELYLFKVIWCIFGNMGNLGSDPINHEQRYKKEP